MGGTGVWPLIESSVVSSDKSQGSSLVSVLAWKWPLQGPTQVSGTQTGSRLSPWRSCASGSEMPHSLIRKASTVPLPCPSHRHLLTLLTQRDHHWTGHAPQASLCFTGDFYCRFKIIAHLLFLLSLLIIAVKDNGIASWPFWLRWSIKDNRRINWLFASKKLKTLNEKEAARSSFHDSHQRLPSRPAQCPLKTCCCPRGLVCLDSQVRHSVSQRQCSLFARNACTEAFYVFHRAIMPVKL